MCASHLLNRWLHGASTTGEQEMVQGCRPVLLALLHAARLLGTHVGEGQPFSSGSGGLGLQHHRAKSVDGDVTAQPAAARHCRRRGRHQPALSQPAQQNPL